MNRSKANLGRGLEAMLDYQHAVYAARGAYCQRNPTPYRVTGTARGGLLVVPERDAPPDYLVVAGGVAYLLDAKSSSTARWPLDNLQPHQSAAFGRWEEQGPAFVAGVVLLLGDRSAWWLPWRALAPRWRQHAGRVLLPGGRAAPGSASLDVPWLSAHATRLAGVDWLAAAAGR